MNTPDHSLSRREWMERMSIPVLATSIGAALLPSGAAAAEPASSGSNPGTDLGAGIYNVRAFGAKGDGKTLDSAAVQAAIDACHRDRGGVVLVPAGDFLVGTIELKSNITLHLAAQGRLLGSSRREDYSRGNRIPPGNGNLVMLYAADAENVTIEGGGTIDGDGGNFYTGQGDGSAPGSQQRGNVDRPHLLIFSQCRNLLVRDVFFTRSAYHCIRILRCHHVRFDGVRIYNRINKNNDGFHFNSSEYVHISNCAILCQDDACALFGSNKFVTVTNCTFSTRWSIFRFGGGEAQNITVSNCLIYETYGCPIKISAGRSRIENLTFSDIVMKDVTGPIGIGFSGGGRREGAGTEAGPASFVRNVVFRGIRARVVREPLQHSDMPFEPKIYDGEQNSCLTLNGVGDAWLENISLTDVHVVYAGGGSAELAAKRDVPRVAREYFGVWDQAPFGPPAYGLYARNVKGLTLHNVRLENEQPDNRPAVVFDNVQDASVMGLSAKGNPEAESLLRITNSRDLLLTATRVLAPAAVFLQLEGSANQGIIVDGGDLSRAAKPLALARGATADAIKLRV